MCSAHNASIPTPRTAPARTGSGCLAIACWMLSPGKGVQDTAAPREAHSPHLPQEGAITTVLGHLCPSPAAGPPLYQVSQCCSADGGDLQILPHPRQDALTSPYQGI